MASSFFSNLVTTNPLEVEILLKDAHQLPQTMGHDENGHPEVQYLYTATDLISGTCTVKLKQKNKVDHLGIKIELIGQVELSADKGQPYEFTSLVRELEGLGELTENKTYSFEFANVDKSYETYHGNNVRLRYFLRVKVARQVWPLTKTLDFQVQNIGTEPDSNASIKMEVGIEDCFTADHEVLTSNGFKAFTAIGEGDLIAAVLPQDGGHSIELQAPVRQASGRLYLEKELSPAKRLVAVKTPLLGGVALTTTETHDWYVETQAGMDKVKIGQLVKQQQPFRLMAAVPGGFTPSAVARAEWRATAKELGLVTDDHEKAFLELYGYWCSDGRLSYGLQTIEDGSSGASLPCVQINTVKDKAYIEGLFARLGFEQEQHDGMGDYSYSAAHGDDEHRFGIKKEAWRRLFHSRYVGHYAHGAEVDGLDELGCDDVVSQELSVPDEESGQVLTTTVRVIKSSKGFFDWVFSCLTRAELRVLIHGYRVAGGSCCGDESCHVLYTSSPQVRDELTRLFLLAGFSAKSRVLYPAGAQRDALNGVPVIATSPSWAVSYSDTDSDLSTSATTPTVQQQDCTVLPAQAGLKVYCVTVPSGLIIVRKKTGTEVSQPVVCGNCLHIEFEYNKSKYHLQDVVIGKIFFLLVRIKIKHMEVVIIKRETTPGAGGNQAQSQTDSENITKYEIMDGAPVRGESIPVRLFLSPYELTPSYKNVHNKFSVRYYLNLVLVDDDDRRYFKQQEITMWRRQLKTLPTPDEKPMFDNRQ